MRQESKEWYDLAVMDLKIARYLEETYRPKPLEIIMVLKAVCQSFMTYHSF